MQITPKNGQPILLPSNDSETELYRSPVYTLISAGLPNMEIAQLLKQHYTPASRAGNGYQQFSAKFKTMLSSTYLLHGVKLENMPSAPLLENYTAIIYNLALETGIGVEQIDHAIQLATSGNLSGIAASSIDIGKFQGITPAALSAICRNYKKQYASGNSAVILSQHQHQEPATETDAITLLLTNEYRKSIGLLPAATVTTNAHTYQYIGASLFHAARLHQQSCLRTLIPKAFDLAIRRLKESDENTPDSIIIKSRSIHAKYNELAGGKEVAALPEEKINALAMLLYAEIAYLFRIKFYHALLQHCNGSHDLAEKQIAAACADMKNCHTLFPFANDNLFLPEP